MTRHVLWSAPNVELVDASLPEGRWPLLVLVQRGIGHRSTPVERERARALRDALTVWLDDGPPADPDTIRAAVETARAELRGRSSAPKTTEEARTELAWADAALRNVLEAVEQRAVRT